MLPTIITTINFDYMFYFLRFDNKPFVVDLFTLITTDKECLVVLKSLKKYLQHHNPLWKKGQRAFISLLSKGGIHYQFRVEQV